ncbi:hypothetical protein [Enterobacter roggenkampii]|uniref:hypothetical protein n=1 Tax=Enterobacter roggenkampii TaxID=1812935 RepID=UPI001F05A382|nr:hypothetical protein [Enterobacter roggenkampii]
MKYLLISLSKQTILLLMKKATDRDAAAKALSDIMKQIEFDVTAAELAAYLFKPGHKGEQP